MEKTDLTDFLGKEVKILYGPWRGETATVVEIIDADDPRDVRFEVNMKTAGGSMRLFKCQVVLVQ